MKKTILILAIVLSAVNLFGQNISGKWNGLLNIHGRELRIVFDITKNGRSYSATMDSPDQGAMGIPVKTTSYSDSILTLYIAEAGIEYLGDLSKENTFIGMLKQSGELFPLVLTKEKIKSTKQARVERPTMVAASHSYYIEDITFQNPKDNITLAGTFTLPITEKKSPAVILISGSGPQNRNAEAFGHKPFEMLADYLTSNGIAVLRFDDRGTGSSTGNFENSTTADFATDVEAALSYLKSRPEINTSKIGLIGHSEGGIIAPMVAAASKDVNFIVLLAGTGIPGDELILLQQELTGQISGVGEMPLLNDKVINGEALKLVANANDEETLETDLQSFLAEEITNHSDSKLPLGIAQQELVNQQVKQLTSPWFKFFVKHNPALVLQKVTCPVLALNGEKDLQVPAKINLEAIKGALDKGGNKNVKTKVLPGLNHMFQKCSTGSPAEYASIKQSISPVALYEIGKWVVRKTN
ncbi:MAG TPA: alpha/beta fold hydrolase [Paludibacter sp.]